MLWFDKLYDVKITDMYISYYDLYYLLPNLCDNFEFCVTVKPLFEAKMSEDVLILEAFVPSVFQ